MVQAERKALVLGRMWREDPLLFVKEVKEK